MLDTMLAQTISNTVASKIVAATKDAKIPEESWKSIVKIIVEEVFTQIKANAVIKIDPTTLDVSNSALISSPTGGPVIGSISSIMNPITGKIT
jgi:hypothetical protein